MGVIQSIKNAVAPPKSADDLRAALSRAESEHGAALNAWSEDETPQRWKLVEDAEREVKQLRVRLTRAERAEADERAAEAERERAKVRAELDTVVARLESREEFDKRVASVVEHARALRELHEWFEKYVDACAGDMRDAADLARRLGMPTPKPNYEIPHHMPGIETLVRRSVRDATIKDRGELRNEAGAADMIVGTTR